MTFVLSLLMGAFVGFFLGFFGSGGSVLAVPTLVYVLGMGPKEAIASSLVIVGASSISGSIQKIRLGQVCYKIATIFGFSGVLGAFSGAKISVYLSGSQQLSIFAVLMLVSAGSMLIQKPSLKDQGDTCHMARLLASLLGFGVGVLTGLVGVGGGFLIVPALSALGGLNIRMAMGSSLLIISLNAVAGTLGYVGVIEFHWPVLLSFIFSAALASLLGAKLSPKINPDKMKKAFSIFILMVGTFLLFKNLRGLG